MTIDARWLLPHITDGKLASALLSQTTFDEPIPLRVPVDPQPTDTPGGIAAAATEARYVNDQARVAKLAKHRSVQVRRAAAANTNLTADIANYLANWAVSKSDEQTVSEMVRHQPCSLVWQLYCDVPGFDSLVEVREFARAIVRRGSHDDIVRSMDHDTLMPNVVEQYCTLRPDVPVALPADRYVSMLIERASSPGATGPDLEAAAARVVSPYTQTQDNVATANAFLALCSHVGRRVEDLVATQVAPSFMADDTFGPAALTTVLTSDAPRWVRWLAIGKMTDAAARELDQTLLRSVVAFVDDPLEVGPDEGADDRSRDTAAQRVMELPEQVHDRQVLLDIAQLAATFDGYARTFLDAVLGERPELCHPLIADDEILLPLLGNEEISMSRWQLLTLLRHPDLPSRSADLAARRLRRELLSRSEMSTLADLPPIARQAVIEHAGTQLGDMLHDHRLASLLTERLERELGVDPHRWSLLLSVSESWSGTFSELLAAVTDLTQDGAAPAS